MEKVVPEELEDVPLPRLRPLAPNPRVLWPLVQSAKLQQQPQKPPVVVLTCFFVKACARVVTVVVFVPREATDDGYTQG